MEYRVLGRSGVAVSELCLGTMTFGNSTSEQESIQIIHRFLDFGGNFIDTANVYVQGRSEEIIGKAIEGRRSEVVLATKARIETEKHVNGAGLSRKHIVDSVDASLKRLRTDYIDLYQMHVWDHLTPVEETLRTLDDLVSSGKVRYIGCSNFYAWQLMKSLGLSDLKHYVRYISVQPQYSLVCREMDRELLPLCLEEHIAVLPWGPLGSGFLTGKYQMNEAPTSGRLSYAKGEASWDNRNTIRNFAILDEVKQVASELGKTPAQVALNWLLAKEGITSPIFGANSIEQFEDNIGAVGWRLPQEHWSRLDEVSRLPDEYLSRFIEKFKRQT